MVTRDATGEALCPCGALGLGSMSLEEQLAKAKEHTESSGIHAVLGIKILEFSPEKVVLSIPITPAVHQPFGLLHGGVSALLAESAASMGGAINCPEGYSVVGVELSASHLRGISEGTLIATATPIRVGRSIQVWHIALTDQDDRMICDAKCTVAVISITER